jgi:hypothetical protein
VRRQKMTDLIAYTRLGAGRERDEMEKPIRHVFLFIGADPETGWLRGCGVSLDAKGFVLTGLDVPPCTHRSSDGPGHPLPFEGAAVVASLHTRFAIATAHQ